MKNPSIPEIPQESEAMFWKHNTFIVLAMSCILINCLYYVYDHMGASGIVEGLGIWVLFLFMLFNRKGFFELPKLLSIFFVNMHSFFSLLFAGHPAGFLSISLSLYDGDDLFSAGAEE